MTLVKNGNQSFVSNPQERPERYPTVEECQEKTLAEQREFRRTLIQSARSKNPNVSEDDVDSQLFN